MIQILRKRISDERFLNLIRKFLTAGYVEDWQYHNTYSGTPQGNGISPILSNIYLDQFDEYMMAYVQRFKTGEKRDRNPICRQIETLLAKNRKLLEYKAMKLIYHNGKEIWKPTHRNNLKNNDNLEILSTYNSEIRGFYRYYSLANNSAAIHNFYYVMKYSMLKTFVGKYNTKKAERDKPSASLVKKD